VHVSIQVRDAFADALRPHVASVAGRVHAGRFAAFAFEDVPAIVVDVPSTQPQTDGLHAGRPGLQLRNLLIPITILVVAKGDVQAKLYEIASEIEAVLGTASDDALGVRTVTLASITDPTTIPAIDENGIIAAMTLRYSAIVATREGAPDTLLRS